MKRNFKKLTACVLATMMALGTTTVAFAEAPSEGSSVGAEGEVEGVVNKDVFRVVLPTITAGNIDFILDPEGLLSDAGKDKYQGQTFESGKTLYFQDSADHWTDQTAKFTVINKSTGDIKISLDATVTGLEDTNAPSTTIAMVDSTAIATASAPSLYLDIKGNLYDNAADTDATAGTAATLSSSTVKVTDQVVSGVADGSYVVVWTGSEYEYALKDTVTNADCPRYEFYLTGSCNGTYTAGEETKTVDWLAHKDIKPTLTLTWTITGEDGAVKKADVAAPSIATTEYTMEAGTPVVVTTDFGTGTAAATKISSVKAVITEGNEVEMISNSDWVVVEDNVVTIKAAYVDILMGMNIDREHKIVFAGDSDNEVKTLTVTLKMPTS